MQQNYVELEEGIDRILNQYNNMKLIRRQTMQQQVDGFVCLVHFYGDHNAEKLAFFSQVIDFYIEKYKLMPIIYSGKAMAFLVNPKTQLSKNIYDTSIFAIDLMIMLRLFSNALNLDCGYALAYGSIQLDGENIAQLLTQQQIYTGKIMYDLYKISGCVLNKIIIHLTKSEHRIFIRKKEQLHVNTKPFYKFTGLRQYAGFTCMEIQADDHTYRHLIRKMLIETSKTNTILPKNATTLDINKHQNYDDDGLISLLSLANKSQSSQSSHHLLSTFDSYSQSDSQRKSVDEVCFTVHEMQSYLTGALQDSLMIDETFTDDMNECEDNSLMPQEVLKQQCQNPSEQCSEMDITIAAIFEHIFKHNKMRMRYYFNNIYYGKEYIEKIVKDSNITMQEIYQPNIILSAFVYFISGIYILCTYKVLKNQTKYILEINVCGFKSFYQHYIYVQKVIYILLTITYAMLMFAEFKQWQSMQYSVIQLRRKFICPTDCVGKCVSCTSQHIDTTNPSKLNMVLPKVLEKVKVYTNIISQVSDAINIQVYNYLLKQYSLVYESKNIMAISLMIFMTTMMYRIGYFLNAVSNFPIYFFSNMKKVFVIIFLLAQIELLDDVFQGINIFLILLQQLPVIIYIYSAQINNIKRQQISVARVSSQFDKVTNIHQLDELTTRLLTICQQIPQLQRQITCNANITYYQVHQYNKYTNLFTEISMSKNQLILLEILQSQINQYTKLNYLIPIIDHGYCVMFRIILPYAGYQQQNSNTSTISSQTALKGYDVSDSQHCKLPICNNNVNISKLKKSYHEEDSISNYRGLYRNISMQNVNNTQAQKSVQLQIIANDIKMRHPNVFVQPPIHNFIQFVANPKLTNMKALLKDVLKYKEFGLTIFNTGFVYSFQVGLYTLRRAWFGETSDRITQLKYQNYAKGIIICPDTPNNRKVISECFQSFYVVHDGVLQANP